MTDTSASTDNRPQGSHGDVSYLAPISFNIPSKRTRRVPLVSSLTANQ